MKSRKRSRPNRNDSKQERRDEKRRSRRSSGPPSKKPTANKSASQLTKRKATSENKVVKISTTPHHSLSSTLLGLKVRKAVHNLHVAYMTEVTQR